MYEKYSEGFSFNTDNPTSGWTDAQNFKIDLKKQNTDRWWGIKFSGYFTAKKGGRKVINADGTLVGKNNTQFYEDTTLYAQYDSSSGGITIKYVETDAEDRTAKCDIDGNCNISNPTKCTDGQMFSGWKCTSGCTKNIVLQPGDNFENIKDYIPSNNDPLEITLTATFSSCPKGYYCTCNGSVSKKEPCPMGSTTDGTGKSKIDDCIMKRGNNGTKFCDEVGCFYLPGTGNIAY